jgi:hypothetical protein
LGRQDVLVESMIENLAVFIPSPASQDTEPVVAIAVVVLRESSPPGLPVIYAPHWGCLMTPHPERYGDNFEKTKGRRDAEAPTAEFSATRHCRAVVPQVAA